MKTKPKKKNSVKITKREYELLRKMLASGEVREQKLKNRIFSITVVAGIFIVIVILGWYKNSQSQAEAKTILAGQLSAQSQLLYKTDRSKQMTALLLAVESLRLSPNVEAAQVVMQNNLLYPVSSMEHLQMTNGVELVGFTPDNQYIVSLGFHDNTVRVWDVETGKEISHMTHDYSVWSADISPDGKYVVSCSEDRTIRVWEIRTGKEITRMWHDAFVRSVAFSSDGKYVLSTSRDKTARIWDVETGEELIRFVASDSTQAPTAMFSPDGKTIVDNAAEMSGNLDELGYTRIPFPREFSSISPNGKFVLFEDCEIESPNGGCDKSVVLVWEIMAKKVVTHISLEKNIWVTMFSPDSQFILTGGDDNYVRVVRIDGGKEVIRFPHTSEVVTAAFSPDNKYVISSSRDGLIHLWDIGTGREIANAIQMGVGSMIFSPDGNSVATASGYLVRVWKTKHSIEIANMNHGQDTSIFQISPNGEYTASASLNDVTQENVVRIWETETGSELASLIQEGDIAALAFSSDSKYLVTGSFDKTVRVWDVNAGKEISRMVHDDFVYSVGFSPDNRYVVSGSKDKTVRIWNTFTGQVVMKKTFDDAISLVAFSPDGKYIISAGDLYFTVYVWESETGKIISKMIHDDYKVQAIDFSPDGKFIASGGDPTVRVWELATGREIARTIRETLVTSVDFSPNGNYVVSTNSESLLLTEAYTGKVIKEIKNYSTYAQFSPDGKYIIAVSWKDDHASIIDVSTGKEIVKLNTAGNGYLRFAGFGPSGKYAITGKGNTIQVWLYRPEDLIFDACSRVTQNLTREEWNLYIGDFLQYQAVCPNLPSESEIE